MRKKNAPSYFSAILRLAVCSTVLTFGFGAVSKSETFSPGAVCAERGVFLGHMWLRAAIWVQEGSESPRAHVKRET